MSIQVLRDRAAQLLSEAQRAALAGFKTAEDRANFNNMLADVESIEKMIEAEERVNGLRKVSNEPAILQSPHGKLTTMSADERAAGEKRALTSYIKYGHVAAEDRSFLSFTDGAEKRDLTTINSGAIVPQSYDSLIADTRKSFGDILSLVRTLTTSDGSPIKYAGTDDVSNVFVEITEDTNVNLTGADPIINGGTLSSTSILTSQAVLVTLAELGDASFDVSEFLRTKFAQRYYRGISSYVWNGSSSTNYASLKTQVLTNKVTSAAAGVISYADIIATYSAQEPAFENTSTWIVNSNTRGHLLGLTNSIGSPLMVFNGQDGNFHSMVGRPVAVVQQMDSMSVSTGLPLALGSWADSYVNRVVAGSLSIARLSERFLQQGAIGFLSFARGGGYIPQYGSVAPFVGLQMHA
jgi:HK97 family phage major capsid protein